MIDLGTEGKHLMEIVAFDTDDRADGNGKAGITWISKDLMNKTISLNQYNNGYVQSVIKPLIPTIIMNGIVTVTKLNGTSAATSEDIWCPNLYEMGISYSSDTQSGATYSKYFNTNNKRRKKWKGKYWEWWTRSIVNGYRFFIDDSGQKYSTNSGGVVHAIALGFCTN